MCGICGAVSTKPDRFVDDLLLKQMCRVMEHRGPDEEGYYLDEYAGLGMRRLSIIDLSTGRQPITNETGTLWIVFNGEIYNYQTLRRQLESRGHLFATKSDTEVILHAFEEYGDRCVEQLNGMFTFASTGGGLRSNRINDVFVDRENTVWVGGDRGISRFDIRRLTVDGQFDLHHACDIGGLKADRHLLAGVNLAIIFEGGKSNGRLGGFLGPATSRHNDS